MSGDRNGDGARAETLLAAKKGIAFVLFGSLFVAAAAAVLFGTLVVVRAQGLPERTASLAALVAFVACVAGGTYLLVVLDRQ